jgi:dienelactone hydrolase
MKYLSIILFALIIGAGCAERTEDNYDDAPGEKTRSIITEEVSYTANGTELKGFLAFDENADGELPGVIVVHEWWGQNEYARERARQLAELGYAALAIDMYGEGKTTDHPDDAGKFSSEVMKQMETARARFNAGLDQLKNRPNIDTSNIAAIGYCFGGGIVLNMALAGADVDGVVSFHGMLPTDPVKNPDQVKAKILVLNGEADPMVTQDQIDTFKENMDNANVDYEVVNYPDAKHAFTNPAADSVGKKFEIPLAYDKEADEKSWQEMKDFLADLFK